MTVRGLRPWLAVAGVVMVLVTTAFVTTERSATRPANPLAQGSGSCWPEQLPSQQFGLHLIGDRPPPVPYSSTPPTSGWHTSGGVGIEISPPGDPLSEPQQVSILEAGGVVVTYHRLSEADRGQLEAHVRDRFPGRVAVTSYDKLGYGQVALTAWGVLQRCEALDLAALDSFVATHAAARPETPGTH